MSKIENNTETNYDQYNITGEKAGLTLEGAWEDYSGQGVTVAVLDTSIEIDHIEIAHAYDATRDRDFVDNDNDASLVNGDSHGTAVASLIVGKHDDYGMDGVAQGATIFGARMLEDFSYAAAAGALNYSYQHADVINNSWGSPTPFNDDHFHSNWYNSIGRAYEAAVENGRGGLGSIVVNSAGNYKEDGDNTNYHSQKNAVEVIVAGNVDANGDASNSSSPGASVLVSAGATYAIAADLMGAAGSFSGDYKMSSGTSLAAPQVSGVVALMLEANPELGWRDVQEILAITARKTGTENDFQENGATNHNGGGMYFSDDVGFGVVDATAAVRLAETWEKTQTSDNLITKTVGNTTSQGLSSTGTWTSKLSMGKNVDHIEKVEVYLNISHSNAKELSVTITSPSGTEAVLIAQPGNGTSGASALRFITTANTFWGESDAGEWTLEIRDHSGSTAGILNEWSLTVLGDADTNDTLHVYTDEFVSDWSTARSKLEDGDGGTDTVNMAAVTENIDFDMNAGRSGSIGGKSLKVMSGTQIERAFLGSGDDEVQGNALDNMIDGGRGRDTIDGGAGDDVIFGGRGNDDLSGGAGADVFALRDLRETGDTVSDFSFDNRDSIDVDALCEKLGVEPLGGCFLLEERSGGSALVYCPASGSDVDLVFLQGVPAHVGLAAVLGLGDPLEPVNEDPADEDPVVTDPTPTEPDPVDPTPTEPDPVDPTPTEPDPVDPTPTEPGHDLDLSNNTVYRYSDSDFATPVKHAVNDGSGRAALDMSDLGKGVKITIGLDRAIKILKGYLDISTGTVFEKVILTAENDTYKADNTDNTVLAGDGNDRVDGKGGADYIDGGDGRDNLGGDGGNDTIFGGAGKDKIAGDDGEDWLSGDGDDDRMTGGDGNDTMLGGEGDDDVGGDDGADLLDGGAGDDRIDGDSGNDTLAGGEGDDELDGGKGDDLLQGEAGNDELDGGKGNDTLTGGSGADTMDGGKGNDILFVGDGADEVEGGTEADRFVFVAANAGMSILDYDASEGDILDVSNLLTGAAAGRDPISANLFSYRAAKEGAEVFLDTNGSDAGGVVSIGFIKGLNPVDINALGDGDNHGDTFYDYTNGVIDTMARGKFTLSDQSGNDEIDFSDVDDNVTFDLEKGGKIGKITLKLEKGSFIETIRTGSGKDRITGHETDDSIFSGAGSDRISGDKGHDHIDAGSGDDRVSGDGGNDTIMGDSGDDELDGKSGNDYIDGESGADEIDGGKGDDTLVIGRGADTVSGGDGADIFRFVKGDEDLVITDFAAGEGDTLDVSAMLTGAAAGGDAHDLGLFSYEAAWGGAFVHLDTNGSDSGGVVLLGKIKGLDPVIESSGQESGDIDHTYTYSDDVLGALGKFSADPGDRDGGYDIVDLSSIDSDMRISLKSGFSLGKAKISFSDSVIEEIRAGSGDDRLSASSSDSVLDGGRGDDTIKGGRGDDVLIGGRGDDELAGGSGADTFVFRSQDVEEGVDYVKDFKAGKGDLIDVSDIMDGFGLSGDPVGKGYFHFEEEQRGSTLMFDEKGRDGGVEIAFFKGVDAGDVSGDWFV